MPLTISRRDFLRNLLATVPAISLGRQGLLAQTADEATPEVVIYEPGFVAWCCKVGEATELATYRTLAGARLLSLEVSLDSPSPGRMPVVLTLERDDANGPLLTCSLEPGACLERFTWPTSPQEQVIVPRGGELLLYATTRHPDMWCCGVVLRGDAVRRELRAGMALSITWRGTREELVRRLVQLPALFAGRLPDPNGIVRQILTSVGLSILGNVEEAYDIKSQGGTDAMGIEWAPLAASTLALRRKVTTPAAIASIKASVASMPVARQRQVRIHYERLLDLYQSGNGAGALARRHALSLLRRMQAFIPAGRYKRLHSELSAPLGADKAKKLAVAGSVAMILRDTGLMFNSLSPRINSADRILRLAPGAVTVGSNAHQFKYHQSGQPRKLKADGTPRLPRRQILPDEARPLPVQWQRDVEDVVRDALQSRSFWQQFLGPMATVA